MQVLRLLLPRVHRGYISSSGCPCVCGCCDVIEAQIWNLLSGSLNSQLGEGDLFQKVSSSLVGDCWQRDICFDLKLQNREKKLLLQSILVLPPKLESPCTTC